jgi:hypothetical protein
MIGGGARQRKVENDGMVGRGKVAIGSPQNAVVPRELHPFGRLLRPGNPLEESSSYSTLETNRM